MKKILLSLVVIISLLVYMVYRIYPKEVHFDTQGIKYRLGDVSNRLEQSIHIEIKGTIYTSLTGNKTFKGTINIEGEDLPDPEFQRNVGIRFYKGLSASLIYPYNNYGQPEIFSLGHIYINRDFSRVTITVYDKQADPGQWLWDGKNGVMISAPATNRKDAVNITNELLNLNGFQLE